MNTIEFFELLIAAAEQALIRYPESDTLRNRLARLQAILAYYKSL